MSRRNTHAFSAITTAGGLLPEDLLQRVAAGDNRLPGLDSGAYHLDANDRLGEAINRAWSRLLGAWTSFQDAVATLPDDQPATGITRDRWLLPLLQELGYGRLPKATATEVEGKSFAISHFYHHSPIHLLGCRIPLDRRMKGVAGAAQASPHGLVQDFLNRSDDHLWGILANGYLLRILRDHHSLTRQAYLEFDLQAIMEGEQFSEFRLLWLLCHQSRVEAEKPEECWLEQWFQLARDEGVRALDRLRDGVEEAIAALGSGFLRHKANQHLHAALESGALATQDYYRQLLRLAYRLIFLFVAEDRGALLDPKAPKAARDRYTGYYATTRLRHLAQRRRGSRHPDLWQGLRLVMSQLADGCPELALPALGSFLWRDPEAIPDLKEAEIANHDLLAAIRALCTLTDGGVRRPVSWQTIGAEELGSIYESLLERHPRLHKEAATFELATAAGHERKTTGSYYTPTSLVECLLDSALDPVLDEAAKKPDPEQALLDLKVCDPACGSGHFLVAAARRIARRLAAVRSGDAEPSPHDLQHALREVVGRCLYGVDVNPMAVELCKVSLWMEGLEPGRPLSFLDSHVQCGNSLLGTTPTLMAQGIPDDAFKPIEGDDRAVCTALKRRNRAERSQTDLFHDMGHDPPATEEEVAGHVRYLEGVADLSIDGVREKEAEFRELEASKAYDHAKLIADAWCAAFVWPKYEGAPTAITEDLFRRLRADPERVPREVREEVRRLAGEYRFFHWHLAFPQVFGGQVGGEWPVASGGEPLPTTHSPTDGFDVVLGNPPWEHTELKEKEWFAHRRPDIAAAGTGARRKRMIEALAVEDPSGYTAFQEEKRRHDGVGHLASGSGRYPLCGRGRINTYAVFAELDRSLIRPTGRCGVIVPSGIATDDTTKYFFQDVMESHVLASLFDFENAAPLFPGVHRSYKFCLLTLTGAGDPATGGADFAFFLHRVADLQDPERRFVLTADAIALLNPNTRTCPIFRTRRDADLTQAIYRRVPVLLREAREGRPEENPWGVTFRQGLFNMTSDSHLFRTREQLEADGFVLASNRFFRGTEQYLPLYEAKMTQPWDHRAADVIRSTTARQRQAQPEPLDLRAHQSPHRVAQPLYWVHEQDCLDALPNGWRQQWLVGFTNVTSPTNERTFLPTVIPIAGVGNSMPIALPLSAYDRASVLVGTLSSFAFDFATRQKIGGVNLNFYLVKQLPLLPPEIHAVPCPWLAPSRDSRLPTAAFLTPRVLELTYTAWDLAPFAKDCGYHGPPFRWDEERRFLLRCELDAAFFHLYLPSAANGEWRRATGEREEELARLRESFPTPRDAVDYVLETFPIVKRKDEARWGDYRTKRTILDIYERIQHAIATGEPYQTRLDPPPADPRVAHDPSTRPEWLDSPSTIPHDGRGSPSPIRTPHSTPPHTASPSPTRDPQLGTRSSSAPPEPRLPTTTPAQPPKPPHASADTLLTQALDYLRTHPGPHPRSDIVAALHLRNPQWLPLSKRLATHTNVRRTGEKRGTRYEFSP